MSAMPGGPMEKACTAQKKAERRIARRSSSIFSFDLTVLQLAAKRSNNMQLWSLPVKKKAEVRIERRYDNRAKMAEGPNVEKALLLEASPADRKWFSSASDCLQYLLDNGFHFGVETLRPQGPLASGVSVGILPPRAEALSTGVESEYFHCERAQSSGGRRITTEVQLQRTHNEQALSGHLLYACAHGLPGALQVVLNNKHNVNLNASLPCANEQGLSPLAVASLSPAPPCCELLIEAGAETNWTDSSGLTALHWAIVAGNLPAVKVLLKCRASTDAVDDQGLTPLLYATIAGSHDIASALLKEGSVSVDYQQQATGVSALMCACVGGHVETTKLLLKHRADTQLTDRHGHSAIHCAVWGGSLKCVKVLAAHCRSVLGLRDQWGRTPLLTAAAKGDAALCQYLLKKGAQWGEVDSGGRTVLHWAVLSQQKSCVEFLLDHRSGGGCDLCNLPDHSGATPVHYAAMSGIEETLSLLLSKNGSPSQLDHSGYSPLLWAAASGRAGTVRLLLGQNTPHGEDQHRGEPVSGGEGVLRPLQAASCVGSLEVCQLLVEASAEVNAIGPEGLTPLHCASRFGHTQCAALLLSSGAHVDTLNHQQESSLHLASIHGHAPVARELLERGALRDRPLGQEGNCPIHIASSCGHAEVLGALLNNGCSMDHARSLDGRSPLHLAAYNGHLQCCRLLCERGADSQLRDCSVEGFTALDLAMLNAHSDCAVLLVANGAPTGGGKFHRAALTIQAVWKYHRHKRRWALAQQWAIVVLQRAIRQWLARARACRVREARGRARHRAASIIQYHWRLFATERRRYEATYARLRARLEQERLATSLILSELRSQTQSVRLPTPQSVRLPTPQRTTPPTPPTPNPKYLFRASAAPLPIFPSGSLLFPSQPRKLLVTNTPIITIAERRKSKPSTAHTGLPTIQELAEDEIDVGSDSPNGSRFPPISHTHSLTASGSPISAKISRGSPTSDRQRGSRGGKLRVQISPRHEVMQLSRSASRTRTTDNSHQLRDKTEKLPSVSQSGSIVSPVNATPPTISTITVTRSQRPEGVPKLPLVVSDEHMGGGSPQKEQSNQSEEASSAKIPVHAKPVKIPTQSYITRHSTFKDVPLGYRSLHSRKRKGSSPPDVSREQQADSSTPSGSGKEKGDKHQSVAKAETPISAEPSLDGQVVHSVRPSLDGQVVHSVRRYNKLSEVLSLLQDAREAQSLQTNGERLRMSELKQHIKTALDEAVRLRADTEALQDQAEGTWQAVS